MLRSIDGKPYFLRRTETGYGVTSATKLTDRFHRSYSVQTAPDGEPLRCSCPDCYFRRNWCKHLQAVEVVYREEHPDVDIERREAAIAAGILP